MQSNIRPSLAFAIAAHEAVGQKRKYTNEPYWTHPAAVADILIQQCHWATPEMIAAADLHDVVEDTGVSLDIIDKVFGPKVALYVDGLTERKYPGLNRAKRKDLEAMRLGRACREVQTIKLCDLIHNTVDITEHDPDFAKVYMREKRDLLLHGLRGGDVLLWLKANEFVEQYFANKA